MKRKNVIIIAVLIAVIPVVICIAKFTAVNRNTSDEMTDKQLTAADDKQITYENYIGKKVGILKGSSFEEDTLKYLHDSEYCYYDSLSDLLLALSQSKIDCFIHDEPVLKTAVKGFPKVDYIKDVIEEENYSFVFQKDAEKGEILQQQFNEMLADIKESGKLESIKEKWFDEDESLKTIDISGLTGENGALKVFVVPTNIPFAYISDDNELRGYAVELTYMFCRRYGYTPDFEYTVTADGLEGIAEGKYDVGASCVTITEERKKFVRFSEPIYNGGTVLCVRTDDIKKRQRAAN
ncbi:MAG: transporter substrate-binding domain-containing protein [Firmicutes bacterium]|nr:transporter substrate-binding domain-containing protein [Bacillota bacterium]